MHPAPSHQPSTESMPSPTSGGIHSISWPGKMAEQWYSTFQMNYVCSPNTSSSRSLNWNPGLAITCPFQALITAVLDPAHQGEPKTLWGPLAHCSVTCITKQLPYYYLHSQPWQSSGSHSILSGSFVFWDALVWLVTTCPHNLGSTLLQLCVFVLYRTYYPSSRLITCLVSPKASQQSLTLAWEPGPPTLRWTSQLDIWSTKWECPYGCLSLGYDPLWITYYALKNAFWISYGKVILNYY